MRIARKYGYLVIEGKYYDSKHINGKEHLIEVDISERLEKAKEIAKKLKNNLDREKILIEAIMKEEPEDTDRLYHLLFETERKYKPKTREEHCVDMKIGNYILPIVD